MKNPRISATEIALAVFALSAAADRCRALGIGVVVEIDPIHELPKARNPEAETLAEMMRAVAKRADKRTRG